MMNKIFRYTAVILLCCIFICTAAFMCSCELLKQKYMISSGEENTDHISESDSGSQVSEIATDNVEPPADGISFIDTLTLEQKVGQLFVVRSDALDPDQTIEERIDSSAVGITEISDDVVNMIRKYQIGGVCQFGKNIVNPEQIIKFNADLQSVCDIPMFLAVDEEGGSVARLANNPAFDLPKYKSAYDVACSGNASDVENMARSIGNYLSLYGFNMNFAPVADVNTNPENPVIGVRAFSSDAVTAAAMVCASTKGFRESGILPTLKHFPGHGDTSEDSHTSLAITYKSLEELRSCEFLPFQSDSGMHAVMVGHIAVPNITGTYLPATFSSEIINLIPNREDTLIITDSLEMQAITDNYSAGEAAILAFNAGCDILLMPSDLHEAYEAVLNAVLKGEISEERLNKSVNKILNYKDVFVKQNVQYDFR